MSDKEMACDIFRAAVFGDNYENPPKNTDSIEIAWGDDEFLLTPGNSWEPIAEAIAKARMEGYLRGLSERDK